MEPLSATASVIGVVELTTKVVTLCSKYYSTVKDAKHEIERLQYEVEDLKNVLNHTRVLLDENQARKLLAYDQAFQQQKQLTIQFEFLESRLNAGARRKTMHRFGMRALRWPLTRRDVDAGLQILERFKSTITIALTTEQLNLAFRIDDKTSQIQATLEDSEWATTLSKLKPARHAAYNSRIQEHEDRCFPDTRVDLLRHIISWGDDPDAARIFWLNGKAGTGKSTISRTIAAHFAHQTRLGASFFFSRGRGDLRNAEKLFSTIAAQLGEMLPSLRNEISTAVAKHYSTSIPSLSDQWKYLISEPLANLDALSKVPSPVIVIDALDECEDNDDIRLIVNLFSTLEDVTALKVRLFLASRPEMPTRLGFRDIPSDTYQDMLLHDTSALVVQHDITVFLKIKLEAVRKDYGLESPWPHEHEIELLVEKAAGLFIFAATACRFISHQKFSPQEQLSLVLRENTGELGSHSTRHLDAMYTQALKHAVLDGCHPDDHGRLTTRFKRVVGSVVAMLDVLTMRDHAQLLETTNDYVASTLRDLHSVLEIHEEQNQPVRIFHHSFRDFLLDRERCSDEAFWVDGRKTHSDIFRRCLKLMSNQLRSDICDLKHSGTSVDSIGEQRRNQFISQSLQYSCQYWLYHFQRGCPEPEDYNLILEFFRQHFPQWLEVLIILRKLSHAMILLSNLMQEITQQNTEHSNKELTLLVSESNRFTRYFRFIMEDNPLQIYCSALLFSPEQSLIRRQHGHCIPHWIQRKPQVSQHWGPSLQVLQGHSRLVNAITFSPNGQLVVSASEDHTIKLWDVETGALCNTLRGHFGPVTWLVLLRDGRLASGSLDKTIRLWNLDTGTSQNIVKDHPEPVENIAFSSSGKLLASASRDYRITLWHLTTEMKASIPHFGGHSGWINAIVFSPDETLMASASNDHTIRLWNIETRISTTLQGHSSCVRGISFSPDGKLIASGSLDDTVRLWSIESRTSHVLGRHSGSVEAVSFSPDGKYVVSGSMDKTVRLWDLERRTCNILEGHFDPVSSVAFSPNGHLIASASFDHTSRLWDTKRQTSQPFEGRSGGFTCLALSPDGKTVASASLDSDIKFWKLETGVSYVTLKGHVGWVGMITFSPNGKLVGSASSDRTIKLWNATTGMICGTLEGHSDMVETVAFSPDSKRVASGSEDTTVRIWNVENYTLHCILEGHLDVVNAVAFSPDGNLLASTSDDTTIRLWNVKDGTLCKVFAGHSRKVRSVAFSLDGNFVVSTSDDETMRLWDVREDEALEVLPMPIDIGNLRFSNDSSQFHTNRGIMDVPLKIRDRCNIKSQTASPSPPFLVSDSILACGDHLINLPPDYQPTCVAVSGSLLVMGLVNGQVTFTTLDLTTTGRDAEKR